MKIRLPLLRAFSDITTQKKKIFVTTIVGNLISTLKPFIYILFPAKLIDELSSNNKNISNIIILAISAVTLNFLFSILDNWLSNRNQNNAFLLDMTEKNAVSKKLFNINYNVFNSHDMEKKIVRHRNETNDIDGIYCTCVWVLENLVSAIFGIIVSVLSMQGFMSLLFTDIGSSVIESKFFSFLLLGCIFIVAVVLFLISIITNKKVTRIRDDYSNISDIYEYYLKLVCNYKTGKEIRIFNLQNFIKSQSTAEILDKGCRLKNKIATYYAFSASIGAILFMLLSFGLYLIVGLRTRAGLCSFGDMIIYIGCFSQIVNAIRNISDILGCITSLNPRAKLFYEIMDIPEPPAATNQLVNSSSKTFDTLECKNLCFKYSENNNYAISGINFKVNKGERIALVGENGSGKTTFIKLLCGLYEPTKGSILINGEDINNISKPDYYKWFSVTFQDYNIFSLPLGENIATSQNVDNEKVTDLLESVGFGSKYTLDKVMYKDCDETGIEISGGEAQKIALARTLYKNSPIIILDEPTAALDPFAEYKLYSQFNRLTSDKTVLYITHRLSSCRFCDKIAVFSNGEIVQFGSHDELVKDVFGKYYELWNAQAKYYNE